MAARTTIVRYVGVLRNADERGGLCRRVLWSLGGYFQCYNSTGGSRGRFSGGTAIVVVMLFGSTETFAIEAMVEPGLAKPSAVWGRMRVWCDGVALGDYENPHCALYPAYTSFASIAPRLRTLWEPEFDALSDRALMNLLDAALYGYHGDVQLDDQRSLEQCTQDARHYGRYDFLTNWGEQFDETGKSFIVCKADGYVRILNTKTAKTLVAPAEAVERAIDAFLRWFESESERLASRST